MQPKVDFHILPSKCSGLQALHFACKLIDQLWQQQQTVFINSTSEAEAAKLDDILWTFAEDSFVPHQLASVGSTKASSPVTIAYNLPPRAKYDVLMNFAPQVPTFYKDASHVIEIVFPDPVVQQLARERYKYYRDQGIQIQTHKS